MEKILKIFIVASVLTALLLLPGVMVLAGAKADPPAEVKAPAQCTIARATGLGDCPGVGTVVRYEDRYTAGQVVADGRVSGALCCLMSTVNHIIDWVFFVLIAISVLAVIWGAYLILTAGGSEDRIAAGRRWITWAAVGIILALFARAIPPVVRAIVGA